MSKRGLSAFPQTIADDLIVDAVTSALKYTTIAAAIVRKNNYKKRINII